MDISINGASSLQIRTAREIEINIRETSKNVFDEKEDFLVEIMIQKLVLHLILVKETMNFKIWNQ